MSETTSSFAGIGIAASVLVHVAAFWVLGNVPKATLRPMLPSTVDFQVQASEPEVEPPEAEPEPIPDDPLPIQPARAVKPAEPDPDPEPQAAEPPVADLTGLTLTNAGAGSGWASAVGNGEAMERPIRAGIAAKAAPIESNEAPTPVIPKPQKPSPPPVVPARDLSERPMPPNLNGVLQSHYPANARKMGLEGTAIVRLRIDPDGRVRLANVVSESGDGFGSACRNTVMGSSWSAPRDKKGKSVATYVKYTCRFRVQR